MARKKIIEPKITIKELPGIIDRFFSNKIEFDKYKKLTDTDNKTIKEVMLENKLDELPTEKCVASVSVSKRESFIEEALITKIKDMKIRGIVKKKEYVDMDALENAIYNNKINAADLASCQEVKEVVTLRVKAVK